MKEIVCKYVREGQHAHTLYTQRCPPLPAVLPCTLTWSSETCRPTMDLNTCAYTHRQREGKDRGGYTNVHMYVHTTYKLRIVSVLLWNCLSYQPTVTDTDDAYHACIPCQHTHIPSPTHLRTYVRTIRRSSLEMKPSLSTSYTRKTTAVISGCRVQNTGCKVQSTGCRVQSTGCRVQGTEYKVQGAEYRVQGSEYRVQGTGQT